VKAGRGQDILLINATHDRDIVGLDFAEISRIRGVAPYDAVLDILLEEEVHMMSCMWSWLNFRDANIASNATPRDPRRHRYRPCARQR